MTYIPTPIDAIARQQQRDVITLLFDAIDSHDENTGFDLRYRYHQDPIRDQIIEWLDQQQISWHVCGRIADTTGCSMRYRGQIYIDLPVDETNQKFCLLRDYLDYPDGKSRFKSVILLIVTLEFAMTKAHHDEPGFWEDRPDDW